MKEEWEGRRDSGYPLRESTDETSYAVPTRSLAPKPLVCQLLMITPSREDWVEGWGKGTSQNMVINKS